MKWILGKPSVLALNSMTVFAACKSDPAARDTDYLLMFLPASLKGGRTRVLDTFPGLTGGTWQQRPESRGYVRIRSADVNDAPVIQPNYLDKEIDRRIQVTAMKHLIAVLQSDPLKPIIEEFTYPTPLCHTDDEWLDHIRSSGMTSFHPCGTAKMGRAPIRWRWWTHGFECMASMACESSTRRSFRRRSPASQRCGDDDRREGGRPHPRRRARPLAPAGPQRTLNVVSPERQRSWLRGRIVPGRPTKSKGSAIDAVEPFSFGVGESLGTPVTPPRVFEDGNPMERGSRMSRPDRSRHSP